MVWRDRETCRTCFAILTGVPLGTSGGLAEGVILKAVELRILFPEVALVPIDLASEMAAARQRRDEKTAQLIRDSRVRAIQASVRPGSSRAEIEERARGFYPRLRADLLEEAISLVCASSRTPEDLVLTERSGVDLP
jgi:hypothetical protein